MHKKAPELICKLEMIFPPGFFNPMQHLILHLANEAKLGGPVQNRWQYPVEREFKHIRIKCGNKAKIEASIAEAYILEEVSNCRTTYYGDDVPTLHNKLSRYNTDNIDFEPELLLFKGQGGTAGGSKSYIMPSSEWYSIMFYVLNNIDEVLPFMR
jgi:hypothetical protein